MNTTPFCLIILDGFGHNTKTTHNAIAQAHTPTLDYFMHHYPHTTLHASGKYVGLLPGMMGNSEVGHQTIGAGRVIAQPIQQLHEQLYDKLTDTFNEKINTLHIMTLLSDAGVHAHTKHLFDAINAALACEIQHIYIHAFLDGRDTPPQSSAKYLSQLDEYTQEYDHVTLASLHGRFYAMDRDNNWERTKQSYNTLTQKQNVTFSDWKKTLEHFYVKNITDEFIIPTQLNSSGTVKNNDTMLFLNFRPDRARQLTQLFLQDTNLNLQNFITPISYNNSLTTTTLFEQKQIANTLKEQLSNQGKKILCIAETEKYAHVTYFFGGGREQPFKHETQILIPSIAVQNYVHHPEMSAEKITDSVISALQNDTYDVYIINYANADMVGHSGNIDATIKAIEFLDLQLKQLYDECVINKNGTLIITADHGNAEDMFDEYAQQPRTAHTTDKVPFIVINKMWKNKKQDLHTEGLADIKNFVLNLKL